MSLMSDSANVSGTVTSHASGLLLPQGRRVVTMTLGRLLFSSTRLTGSFTAGILGLLDGSPCDVVYVTVMLLSWAVLATRQLIQPSCIHGLAIYTSVWLTGIVCNGLRAEV